MSACACATLVQATESLAQVDSVNRYDVDESRLGVAEPIEHEHSSRAADAQLPAVSVIRTPKKP
jgi:hypothetical protein